MTIGIYKLVWEDSDKVYIGQSVNIERRYTCHKSELNRGVHSTYVQNMYNKYGIPSIEIVEECKIEELDKKESHWIAVTKNVNTGYGGKDGLRGEHNVKCFASRDQIIQVANLLINPDKTCEEINNETGVAIGTIEGIRYRKRHQWLSEEFPELWDKLGNLKTERLREGQKRRYKIHCVLLDPLGTEHEVYSFADLARTHKLSATNFSKLARGVFKQYMGWTLVKNYKES